MMIFLYHLCEQIMSTTSPTLSIIMPVYNTERYISETIESLLNQTFNDFELIVVDDACTDKSIEIVKSFDDPRIRILTNESNKGIVYSRNRGNSESLGKFIAPFDSDDIALPDKFEKQIMFMEQHPEYGMLGTWAKLIDENGQFMNINWRLSAHSGHIPAIMLFRAYFIQSSVIFRREAIPVNCYTEGFAPSEDYKLYYETANRFKTYNYPEYLTYYRIHKNSITQSKLKLCMDSEMKLYNYIFNLLNIEINTKYFSLLQLIKNDREISDLEIVSDIEKFLVLILNQNLICKKYDQKQLNRVVFNRWMKVCFKAKKPAIRTFVKFITSPLIWYFIKSRRNGSL